MINKLKEWAIAHKQATIGICVAVAVVIATGIGYAVVNHSTEPDSTASAQTQETSDATSDETNNDPVAVKIDPKADDSWKDDSSPVILHVQSKDADDDATSDASDSTSASDAKTSVDFYHATSHGADNDTIDLVPGDYTATIVSPVNSDGSIEVYANDNDAKSVAKSIDVTVKPVKTKSDDTKSEGVKSGEAKTTDEAKSDDTKSEDIKSDETKATEDAKSDDKPQTIEIPMTNVPADQVTDDQAKQIADETAKAVEKGDDTLKGDNGTSVLDKVNENIKANPNVSDGTKDSVQSTSEQAKTETKTEPTPTAPAQPTTEPTPTAPAQPTTQPSTPSKDNTSGSTSSSSSTGSSGQSSQTTTPKSTRHWVDEQGHWENTTEQVWVPNVVTVVDTPATTKQVYDHTVFTFSYDGYTTTDFNDCLAHQKALLKAGNPSFYSDQDVYTTQTVPAVTHTEDHGHYETKVTGKKWVVDVAGHWED